MDPKRERGFSTEHTETRIRRDRANKWSESPCDWCMGQGWYLEAGDPRHHTCPWCLGIGSWHG